jgi:phage shock protein A
VVSKLKENMRALESKISEAKTKKDLYIARARSAQASQKINEMLGNMGTGTALSAFERMEEKVMQLEAQSEAIAELGSSDLEKRFASLEGGNEVNSELAAMKANLMTGTESAKLPSAQTSSAQNPEIEAELKKLRSEIEGS